MRFAVARLVLCAARLVLCASRLLVLMTLCFRVFAPVLTLFSTFCVVLCADAVSGAEIKDALNTRLARNKILEAAFINPR